MLKLRWRDMSKLAYADFLEIIPRHLYQLVQLNRFKLTLFQKGAPTSFFRRLVKKRCTSVLKAAGDDGYLAISYFVD